MELRARQGGRKEGVRVLIDNTQITLNETWRALMSTGWQRPIRCLELQVIFCERATKLRALFWKLTYTDKASYGSLPTCTSNQSSVPYEVAQYSPPRSASAHRQTILITLHLWNLARHYHTCIAMFHLLEQWGGGGGARRERRRAQVGCFPQKHPISSVFFCGKRHAT